MKTQPIEASDGPGPGAPDHRAFLEGSGLRDRWAGRPHFVILQTSFGLGHHFLATWKAWRDDPARCERLFYVAVEARPVHAGALASAHAGSPWPALAAALQAAWPPLTPNLHALDFEGGRVQLLLALGEVAALLPGLRLQADAIFLDGLAAARPAPPWQARVIKALGRRAAPDATLVSSSSGPALQAGLETAGFSLTRPGLAPGGSGFTAARWAPRFTPRGRLLSNSAPRHAVVVGGGIAGASVALALARLGVAVTVLERHAEPAAETSGNAAGLFHGTVNVDDGVYARLYRSAALQAQRTYAAAMASAAVSGSCSGLLRVDAAMGGFAALQALLRRMGLPSDYVQALDAAEASALAGVPLSAPAWHYPTGGWLAPAAWVRCALAEPGVQFQGGRDVQGLVREAGQWLLLDAAGNTLARATVVVLASAATVPRLLAPLGYAPWPLRHSRGQVTLVPGLQGLKRPVAGDGYALPVPDGLLCGATRDEGAPGDTDVRFEDHLRNLRGLERLTGLHVDAESAVLLGRTGWRLHTDDRLPIAGAMPLATPPAGARRDQARLLPRAAGLFVLTALGARGLTLAPLLGRLVAAQATGTPWPLEQDLADAVDPGRWLVRAARAAGQLQPAG